MSILIKGMEMPNEAGKYRIEFDQCGNPYLLSDNGDGGLWHIISVPPHGRLIDKDALYEKFMSAPPAQFTPEEIAIMIDWEEVAPTIIPADRKEEE